MRTAVDSPCFAARLLRMACVCSLWAVGAHAALAQHTNDPPYVYVRADAVDGGDGRSWATAFHDLQQAIDKAQFLAGFQYPTVEVRVAQGVYRPSTTLDRSARFRIRLPGILVLGGFRGEGPTPDDRSPAYETVLSGDLADDDGSTGIKTDNSFRVVEVSVEGPAENLLRPVVFDMLTIRGASGVGATSATAGGGMVIGRGRPLLDRIRFIDNSASTGGALYVSNFGVDAGATPLRIIRCEFSMNSLSGDFLSTSLGGGAVRIFNQLSTAFPVRFESCRFTGNKAVGGTGFLPGGAVRADNTDLSFEGCLFQENEAGSDGALMSVGGTLNALSLVRCAFMGNSALAANAGIVQGVFNVTIHGCHFVGNVCTGPMIAVGLGPLGVFSTTCAGNVCRTAISHIPSPLNPGPVVCNSILWGNISSATGATDFNAQIDLGTPSQGPFRTSIVQGTPPTIDDPAFLTDADPQFVTPPSDPRVRNTPAAWGDTRLMVGSPAIDTGENSLYSSQYDPFDTDGRPRFMRGIAGTGSVPLVIDRGCFEFAASCSACPDDRLWFGALGGLWNDPTHWLYGVPDASQTARFSKQVGAPGQYIDTRPWIDLTQDIQIRRFTVDEGDAGLRLNGRTLTLTDSTQSGLVLDSFAGTTSSLAIAGGRLVASGVKVGAAPGSAAGLAVSGPGARLSVTSQDFVVGFEGHGDFLVEGGATAFTRTPKIGDQPGSSGFARVTGPGSRWTVPFVSIVNSGTVMVDNGGVFESAFGTILLQDGELTGQGTHVGHVVNFGVVAPRAVDAASGAIDDLAAILTIDGDFEQIGPLTDKEQRSGTLSLRMFPGGSGRPPSQDLLIVEQAAELAGTLLVQLVNFPGSGSVGGAGSRFELLRSANTIGRFDLAVFPGLDQSRFMRLDYPPASARSGSVSVSIARLANNIDLNPPSTANLGGTPTDIVAADFDGDGDLDLALTVPDANNPTTAPGQVVILKNAGNTGPGGAWAGFSGGQLTVNVGVNPRGLAVDLLNPGASPDLVVANASSNTVSVLLNNGSGAMTVAQTVPVGTAPVAVVTGVFRDNSDGAVDVAVANQGSNSVTLLNNTGGTLSFAATLAAGDSPTDIAAASLDAGSSTLDLAVTNGGDNTVSVYYRPPAGGFPTGPSRVLPTGIHPVHVEPGGLDNPKDINDLAVTNLGGGSTSILLNNNLPGAPAGFQPKADLPSGLNPDSLSLGDLDNDGDDDLSVVTTVDGGRVVRVFRNDQQDLGNGQFQAAFAPFGDQYAGTEPQLVISGDVNNDGREDLIAVNEQTLVFRPGVDGTQERVVTAQPGVATSLSIDSSAPPPCPADLVGNDGVVDTADLVFFLGRLGQPVTPGSPEERADFNLDGEVNTIDLVFFLGRFGQPCE